MIRQVGGPGCELFEFNFFYFDLIFGQRHISVCPGSPYVKHGTDLFLICYNRLQVLKKALEVVSKAQIMFEKKASRGLKTERTYST